MNICQINMFVFKYKLLYMKLDDFDYISMFGS